MNDLRTAAQQALEALVQSADWTTANLRREAIIALKAALAQQDRHALQAEGKHPAPCARHCEAEAYEIELRRLHALVAACEPFLKEGETPAERIERERGDTHAITSLYAKEREKNEELLEALKAHVSLHDMDCSCSDCAAIAKAEWA